MLGDGGVVVGQRVADEDVVDQLAVAFEAARVALGLGDQWPEVELPGLVALVDLGERGEWSPSVAAPKGCSGSVVGVLAGYRERRSLRTAIRAAGAGGLREAMGWRG